MCAVLTRSLVLSMAAYMWKVGRRLARHTSEAFRLDILQKIQLFQCSVLSSEKPYAYLYTSQNMVVLWGNGDVELKQTHTDNSTQSKLYILRLINLCHGNLRSVLVILQANVQQKGAGNGRDPRDWGPLAWDVTSQLPDLKKTPSNDLEHWRRQTKCGVLHCKIWD